MSWIGWSLVLFFSSVALYLCVRKSSLAKIPTRLTNLSMFLIPFAAYSVIGVSGKQAYGLSLWQFVFIGFVAVVFSYGGNKASLIAIEVAPNPGYSLVLSKSYVLFTTVVAVIFLHAELDLRKALAILIIVGFSVLIMVNPKATKKVTTNNWLTLSFGAFFAWGFLSLSAKYLFSHGVGDIPFLTYNFAGASLCILVADKIKPASFKKLKPQDWLLLLAVGIFSTLFNLGQFEAVRLAPNIGYVNAINASSISLVTVLAVIFFKDELTVKKAIGVFGVIVGICLLLL